MILGVLLLSLLTACHSSKPLPPKSPKTLRISLIHDPSTLDPRLGGDLVSSQMHFLLFEGLTRLTSEGLIAFAQANSVDISDDGLLYTFHLRPTRWSNGDPVTAHDFERSWKKILDPHFPAPNAHLLYPIQNAAEAKLGNAPPEMIGISALNDQTLQVSLEHPTPYFLHLISFCVFFPAHRSAETSSPLSLISNGPYTLTTWKHQHELVLIKNPQYWEKKRILSENISISIIPHTDTALKLFEKGDLDLIGNVAAPLPLNALPSLHRQGKLKKQSVAASTLLYFNTSAFPFHNANLRRAFAKAIEREEIVKHITQLEEPTGIYPLPPQLRPFSDSKEPPSLSAQEFLSLALEELNLSKEDLPPLTYCYSASEEHHSIAQAIQQQILKNLGITLHLESCESKIFLDRLVKRDYTLAQTIWMAQYPDPMSLLERLKFKENAKNYAHWEDPRYIALLNQATHETGATRFETLRQAETLLLEEVPLTAIYHWELSYMLQPHLSGMELSPIGDLAPSNQRLRK